MTQPGGEEDQLIDKVDLKKVPAHVAVIMDGNGRWAEQRSLKRKEGHKEGAVSAKRFIEHSLYLGVKHISLYAFSSENWKRPITEINALMNMLYTTLAEEKETLIKNQMRLHILGDIDRLPGKLIKKVKETVEYTKDHKAMQINLALNYGSRNEILGAVKKIVKDGIAPSKINEKLFEKYLYTANCPPPDLLVRTSGELRISNFLLYQIAYSELYFTNIAWPDFRLKEYLEAILEFQSRKRRFGKI
ncbi:MAG: di-trans,poly-cis-decaprenylcistransferase [bacterium]|nr:di-trans,poly-cis-decaprenylcistransferase [bacterium]